MSDSASVRVRWLDAVALTLIVLMAWAVASPLLSSEGWPVAHEEFRYVVLVDRFVDAIRQGEIYPRYLSDLYGGYGYPVFCFYQPALFYLAVPFVWIAGDPVDGLRFTAWFLLVLGGVGAWALCRFLAGRVIGMFGAAVFLLTPYLFVDLYVRGDLSELMGMVVVPWVIHATLSLARRVANARGATLQTLALAGWLALLVTSHPAPALVVAPFTAVLGLGIGVGKPWARGYWIRFCAAAAIGAALTSPYWATLVEMRSYVGFERLTRNYFAPEGHLLGISQLFATEWSFGGSITGTTEDTMPFQLGAMHFGLALLGAWFGRKSRTIVIASVTYAVLICLMLEVSRSVWESAGAVRFLQFPWRLLSVTATLQIIAVAGIHGAYRRHLSGWSASRRSLVAGTALIAWVVATGMVGRDQFSIGRTADPALALQRFRSDGAAPQFRMLGGVSEYVPKTARDRPPRPRDRSLPPFRVNGPGTVTSLSDNDYVLHARVDAERAIAVVIERVYLPDWSVEVNGERLPQEELVSSLTAHGFVRLALPAGSYEIRARYLGPPSRRIRNVVAVSVLAASALLLWILRRRTATDLRG